MNVEKSHFFQKLCPRISFAVIELPAFMESQGERERQRKAYLKGGKKMMQPSLWQPRVGLSKQEELIVKKIRKAKLFVFLRKPRHELFDEAFQEELASLCRPAERGQLPVAPAMLAPLAHSGSLYRSFR